jgi:hypothetical protein
LGNLPVFLTHILMSDTPDQFPAEREDVDAQTVAIRALNDQLRTTLTGGRVVMTQGVNALADDTLAKVLRTVNTFDEFTPDNDP